MQFPICEEYSPETSRDPYVLLPVILGVAGQAFLLPARMGRRMTGRTSGFEENIRACFFPRDRVVLPVACEAIGDLRMGAEKNRTRFLMIEIIGIEQNDRLLRSLMLGVTHAAILILVPVITFPFGYSVGHFGVTGQTSLRRHFQFVIVTLIAIGEPRRILMNGTQISWRIGHIEFLLPLKKRGEHEERNDDPGDEEKGCGFIFFVNVS